MMCVCVCVAVRTQMAAESRLTKRWWSQWPRWRRGSRQTNAVAAKPALLRPYIMLSTASNKCKVIKLHANHMCNWFLDSCLSQQYLASIQHLCLCDPTANSEYYNLLMQNGQDERRDASVFSLEELERVTSEHTLKNTVNMHAEKKKQKHIHLWRTFLYITSNFKECLNIVYI